MPTWDDEELWKHVKEIGTRGHLLSKKTWVPLTSALWGLDDKYPCSPEAARGMEPHVLVGDC